MFSHSVIYILSSSTKIDYVFKVMLGCFNNNNKKHSIKLKIRMKIIFAGYGAYLAIIGQEPGYSLDSKNNITTVKARLIY